MDRDRPAFSLPASVARARLALITLTALAAALAGLLAYRQRRAAAEPLPVLIELEGFELRDQRGQRVKLADLAGQVWIADFMFTGCQAACPMLTSRMRSLQSHLAERERAAGRPLPVRLVSFTVDPEVDTPEKLAAYAAKWSADERRWMFLTGSLAEVNRAVTLGMKIPFEKGGADTSAFDVMHGERLVVVDARARIRGYFETDPDGMAQVKSAIDALLAERAP